MKRPPCALPALVLLLALGAAGPAGAAPVPRVADAPGGPGPASVHGPRAPSGPALTAGAGALSAEGAADEAAASSSQAQADPLVSNGLGSPLCRGALQAGQLPVENRHHCETSGFVAAGAPTSNYGIDVHIDTGLLGLSAGGLLTVVQDLVITPLWMGAVWTVHAVVVMLEWAFTIDVLDSAAAGGVGAGLRRMQATVTDPWLAIVLAVASVLALYNGLIRRRVGETVGQALLMATMMVAGMWVILDPSATVGALGRWANEASLGTLAVAARGSPTQPAGTFAQSVDMVFAAAVEGPWCYLEFGDVGWCRSPARLDPRLRAAALKIAAGERARLGCAPGSTARCAAGGDASANALQNSAQLLRAAQSNGAIFLALPANGPARNAINDQGSLLRTLCQSSEATNCHGPTAAQAEFRTNGGTWPRVGGLLLIVVGLLGMLLLLGFIVLRLLAAAIFSLFYLLLAPGAVLAPALGEGGRALFRAWGARLLGAVLAKLLFSFLLGAVLAVLAILSSLQQLGWWTQWLLMSAFWWGAYVRRHQTLDAAQGAFAPQHNRSGALLRERRAAARSAARRLGDVLETRKALAVAGRRISGLRWAADDAQQPRRDRRAASEQGSSPADEQARRMLQADLEAAHSRTSEGPELERQLASRRAQLERVRREQGRARAAGDARRMARLGHRAQRIEMELQREQSALRAARELAADDHGAAVRSASASARERMHARSRLLDEQATLPSSVQLARATAAGQPVARRRDYPALAALVGHGREQYERLDARAQRAARLKIDRELALRAELRAHPQADSASAGAHHPVRRIDGGPPPPRLRDRAGAAAAPRGGSEPGRVRRADWERSSVLRDAREVQARRKRQLGRGRP